LVKPLDTSLYRRAQRLSPANPFPRILAARAQILSGSQTKVGQAELARTLQDLDVASRLAPWDTLACLWTAQAYIDLWPVLAEAGRAAALDRIRRAILLNPDHSAALVEALWQASRDPAILLQVVPGAAKPALAAAVRLMEFGRKDEAWKLLRRAIVLEGEVGRETLSALQTFRATLPAEEFRAALELLLRNRPREAALWGLQASVQRELGDLAGMEASLRQAVLHAVDHARSARGRAAADTKQATAYHFRQLWDHLHTSGRFPELESSVRDYESIFARDGASALVLARMQEQLGHRDQALALYQESIALGEPDPAQSYLAELLYRLHRYIDAAREWRAILDRRPGEHGVRQRLVETYFMLGDVDEARAVAAGG
jgi:tetratricopeptide (TPR) repeat protein